MLKVLTDKIKTNRISFEITFHLGSHILNLIGADFYSKMFYRGFLNRFRTTVSLISVYFTPFMVIWHIVNYSNNLEQFILVGLAALVCFEVLSKFALMIKIRKKNIEMIDYVIHMTSSITDNLEKEICLKYHNFGRKLVFTVGVMYALTGICLNGFPIISSGYKKFLLPVSYSIPFTRADKHLGYEMNYSLIIIQSIYCVCAYTGIDVPFLLFVSYALMRLDIFLLNLQQLNPGDDEEKITKLLQKLARIHSEVLGFINKISYTLNEVNLIQVLSCLGIVCITLLHCLINIYNNSYGMLLAQITKLFILCYCGDLIVTKVNEISYEIYFIKWYELKNIKHKKIILFMLMNSQRDVSINVGQFGIILSAVTFTKVMKTSYSFCTFLRQIL